MVCGGGAERYVRSERLAIAMSTASGYGIPCRGRALSARCSMYKMFNV